MVMMEVSDTGSGKIPADSVGNAKYILTAVAIDMGCQAACLLT